MVPEIGMATDLIARFIRSRTSCVLARTSFKQGCAREETHG
jgi:hypothetical protein